MFLLLLAPALAGPPAPEPTWLESGILVDGGCSACTETVAAMGGTVHVSSTLTPASGRYDAKHLLDADPATAWCEGAEGPGVGEWIELRFPKPVDLAELHLLTGYAKSTATLRENGRVKVLRIELDGKPAGRIMAHDIARSRDPSVGDAEWLADLQRHGATAWSDQMGLHEAPAATRIRFVIEAVYAGEKYADTCLSTLSPRLPAAAP